MKFLLVALIFLLPQIARSRDKGFALSGGVSLGVYEGGVFYSLISQDKKTIAQDTKVVFGTSAGSINGLLGVFEICGFRESTRESNLLWRTWIPIGLNELEAKEKNEHSLLSRKASAPIFQELKERWKEGFKESCDLHFGVAVSRKEPFVDKLKEGLEIIRQSEFFSVRIRGRGKGKAPLVENQQYANVNSYRSFLPLGVSSEKDLDILLGLIQASSSFPGAFEPYPISFCYRRPGEPMKDCKERDAEKQFFIDGGIYHNGPVGYAFEAMTQTSKDKKFELHYVNASSPLIKQSGNIVKKGPEKNDVFRDFHDLFSNLIVQARKFELDKSLETNPEIVEHLIIRPKHFPLSSEPLYAFNGFFETDFRKSDFFKGMYDGDHEVSRYDLKEDKEYLCFKAKVDKQSECELDQNLEILINLAKYRLDKQIYEGDFDKIYEYLEKKQFEFKDLGLKKINQNMEECTQKID